MIFASVCKISSLFRNRVTQKSLDFYVFSINIVEICKKTTQALDLAFAWGFVFILI